MAEDNNSLAEHLLDLRASGKNYFEIEKDTGIKAAEARQIVNDALSEIAADGTLEWRRLMQIRLEKITQHLWSGLEMGSFKHGDSVLQAAKQLAELMDLNEDTIKKQVTIISDEETLQLFEVLKAYGSQLFGQVNNLPLSEEARFELAKWPQWTAQAATDAVESVLYVEE